MKAQCVGKVARIRPVSAAEEWKNGWPLVLSATAGLSFGGVPTACIGLFMDPLRSQFGWSSAQISIGMTILAWISMLLAPVTGAVLDAFGTRRVVIPGLLFSGGSFAAFAFLRGSYVQWLVTWLVFSTAQMFIHMMVWNRAVSASFVAGRGMAVAALLTGLGLAQVMVPPLTDALIDNFGWRTAFLLLGIGWTSPALLLVILFFHDAVSSSHATSEHEPVIPIPGLTLRQGLRSAALIKIAGATALQIGTSAAVAIHFVPLLVSSGVERSIAASLTALVGVCSLSGQLLNGWLTDRFSSRPIQTLAFGLPALGYICLWQGHGSLLMLAIGTAVFGCAGGASLHMINYLITRYAGLAHFGKIFGVLASIMGAVAGVTPLLAGAIFDYTGNYDLLLISGIPVSIISALLVASLGPYPESTGHPDNIKTVS